MPRMSGMLGMRGMTGMHKMSVLSQDGIPPGDYPSFEIAEWTPWILGCRFREKD